MKFFSWLFWQVSAGKCKHHYCHHIESRLFAAANVVHRDSDLNFQGYEMLNVNIWKTVRDGKKCWSTIFTQVDIYHQIGTITDVVLHDLDFYFQGQTFSCYAMVIQQCTGSGLRPSDLSRLARPPLWNCSCCPSSFFIVTFVFRAKLVVFYLRIFRK